MNNSKVFDPYRTNANPESAYWMARIAKEVYKEKDDKEGTPDDEAIKESLCKDDPGFERVQSFAKNSSEGAVIKHKNYIVAAFRGTDEIGDWLDNLNAFSIKVFFGEFHRGFYKATLDIWPEMKKAIEKLRGEDKCPLWITGHSLGGAMATIAAADLIHVDQPFMGVYTFGSPRCMDRETSRIFNSEAGKRLHRFQNNADIVTRIPARLMGYSHVGNYFYIADNGVITNDVGFWFKFVDCVKVVLDDIKNMELETIEDHDMEKYLDYINKCKEFK